MLKDMMIRTVASDMAYSRGVRYYNQGRVARLERVRDSRYRAEVDGSVKYEVEVRLSKDGSGIEHYTCDCPAASQYLGACKHVVAVLKAIQEEQVDEEHESALSKDEIFSQLKRTFDVRQQGERGESTHSRRMFRFFADADREEDSQYRMASQPAYLVPRLYVEDLYGRTECWLEFRFGTERLYVVRNVLEFLSSKEKGGHWQLGRNAEIDLAAIRWADSVSAKLYAMLKEAHRAEKDVLSYGPNSGFYYTGYHSYIFEQKKFRLSADNLGRFLAVMGDMAFEMRINGADLGDVRGSQEKPQLGVSVREQDGRGQVSLTTEEIMPLDDACRYIFQGQHIYAVSPKFARAVKPLWQSFRTASRIEVPRSEMGRFFSEVLPRIEKAADVEVDPAFLEQYTLQPLTAELYIDYAGDGIAVRPQLCYGDAKFNPLVTAEPPLRDGRHLVRDARGEQEIMLRLSHYGFRPEKDQLVQKDEEKSYDFLTEELPNLPEWVDVFYADSFVKRPIRPMPKVAAGVSVNDMDLLEVTFNMKDLDFHELMDILDSYKQKRRYHRLKDRTFVTLEEQQMQALADFVENAGITRKNAADGATVELPLSHAMYLDELARADENLHLERSRTFRAIVRNIRRPEEAEYEVPEVLRGVLRDYQVTGFNWLSTLADYHLGGILADDMGLGKTLQVIAFLLARQDAAQPPSLVVAPTSLMYNWLDEIARFAPSLKAAAVAGTKAQREEILAAADQSYDVLITTYNMLKRDIALYEKRKFRYAFLDEAQHIKNPTTQNARAVKKLKTGGYFALTGTPIENTLTELWSIFDFLMPGYLLTHKKFKEHYETQIVREQDERSLTDLKRHVMPFILRRMKKDVLKELPDKVERKMVGEMTAKQEKVYQAWFIRSQREFAAELRANGFGESRIKILAILTRLRQIACDPSLFLEGYEGGSGKLDMLEEVVGEAVASGHRILVFSQFTTMLGHIGERLKQIGVPYYYLDGSTPALERIRLVKLFNAGNIPVFLISLKAGGTGLNLTGADMVIHFDPWWNPAVEDQATDRAYRLGQKNNVQVLKFITKGTVEEKIFELQEKKKSLIDQMIQPGDNFLSKLTEEEVRELFSKR
ncbi:Superfamily II DNA or RNA helicase, SNF2 family [Selenomonas sp. GACV-9]|uniref:DEAD/DEAH box helicase n=1 Tax=Selenomonas sp. GACV-9 TaxID=3158782 RepID=UPI0008F07874|nr:Superfamily II DNA or RNA helicase, SNF2 family [Selenomonas ruminantium]